MSNVAYIENEDYKIPGNWERFLKRFQEKFWKELSTSSKPDNRKENNQFINTIK